MHATTPARRGLAALVATMLLIAVAIHAAPGHENRPDRSRPAAVSVASPAAPSVAGSRSDAPGGSHPIALAAVLAIGACCADALFREPLIVQRIAPDSYAGVSAGSRAPPAS